MAIIVGIDLGTSTSEISYLMNGKPTLIPNHLNEFITPSVVHISEKRGIIVGKEAKELLLLEPENTFMEAKRALGSEQLFNNHEPEVVLSHIIKYLIECAKTHLDEDIEEAIITVPAYFTDAQRRLTIKAGELAGITVKRIINEPTAAALNYGLSNSEKCQNILVYDLGGGTLDVTVLELFNGVIDVKASCGNNELGGKDFDEALIDSIINEYNEKYNINIKNNLQALMRLKKACEEVKIKLSTEFDSKIELPFFMEVDNNPIAIEKNITRVDFVNLIKPKIDSSEIQIKQALSDANLVPSDLDLILLVGGSTRIPYVSEFIENELSIDPKYLIDPDLGVALGAAVQAGIINNDSDIDLIITDVCPYTLSSSVLNLMTNQTYCDPLIPRNTTIPVTREKIYSTVYPGQKQVDIKVYQGESEKEEENTFLGTLNVKNIPITTNKEDFKIKFSYNNNGLLDVTATIISTGKEVSATIDTVNTIVKRKVDLSEYKASSLFKKNRILIKKIEQRLKEKDNAELQALFDELKLALINEDIEQVDKLKMKIIDYFYAN